MSNPLPQLRPPLRDTVAAVYSLTALGAKSGVAQALRIKPATHVPV